MATNKIIVNGKHIFEVPDIAFGDLFQRLLQWRVTEATAPPDFTRHELADIFTRAVQRSRVPEMNPSRQRAYERLADSADILDAIISRDLEQPRVAAIEAAEKAEPKQVEQDGSRVTPQEARKGEDTTC